jgi:hypothetical protein
MIGIGLGGPAFAVVRDGTYSLGSKEREISLICGKLIRSAQ